MLGRHTRLLAITFALAAISLPLSACDLAEPGVDEVTVESFEEGVVRTSDDGAFKVVLSTREAPGLRVGANDLHLRLGFDDPSDPNDAGRAIPGADIELSAWMRDGGGAVDGIRGVYVGNGLYRLDLELPEPGVWQFDFALAVGENVDDSISFVFIVGE